MYTFIVGLHNLVRWVVVILAVVALVRAYLGWLGKRPWTPADRRWGMFFSIALDIQFLLGIILVLWLGVGNLGRLGFEHVIPMIVAVVLVHAGNVLARRAAEDTARHRQAALWFTIAVLIILVSIPWSRPLLPAMG